MDRSDEVNCEPIIKDYKNEVDKFKECTINEKNNYKELGTPGAQGFQCGEEFCLDQKFWCGFQFRKTDWAGAELAEKCPDILKHLQNDKFCRDSEFWKVKEYKDSKKPIRCNGNYQGEWSRGPKWACNGLAYSGCRDKSDLVNITLFCCITQFM